MRRLGTSLVLKSFNITIPQAVRPWLEVKRGDKIQWLAEINDNEIRIVVKKKGKKFSE